MARDTLLELIADTRRNTANTEVYARQAAPNWRGVTADKCPWDLLTYQEIIYDCRPDIVLETGSWLGGSALFFADICALNGHGAVLSIDLDPPAAGPGRLTFLQGDSAAPATVERARAWADGRRGLVVLDAAHELPHVLAELDAYAPFVASGCYLVVEDTNINGHPVRPDFGAGPWEALEAWLPSHPEFAVDTSIEPYITFAPRGYLRRLS